MLRPATPLSVLLFIAFAFLLVASISTPIVKAIPLGTYNGVDFGVFGYCQGNKCSSIKIGYSMSNIFTDNNGSGDFSLPESLRNSVSAILVIHPVAAFLTLACFGLAVGGHFHSPAHSARYLLGLFILTIPTFLLTLLSFLVDVLLFIPNVGWAGWLVLASSIIILISSVVVCGMRRSLVSRKARRKRIAENAEMNGESYFETRKAAEQMDQMNQMGQMDQMDQRSTLPKAESPPPLSGDTVTSSEKGSGFAPFDLKSDDKVPLNPSGMAMRSTSRGGYNDPGRPGPPGREPQFDQYGNPLPPGSMGGPLRQQDSNGSLGSTPSSRSGGPPPGPYYGRGRGGYPPMPGRGGYPPRGGMMRGGPPGMRGPPPPGWNGRGRGGMSPGMMGRGGYPPPRGGYGGYGPPPGPMPGRGRPSMEDPGMIGQAVEMDERVGIPSPSQSRPNSGPREGQVPGMVGMMQPPGRGPMSPTSDYDDPARSPEPYIPARSQWNQRNMTPVMNNRALSPIQASPPQLSRSPPRAGARAPSAADNYVEDIDPRFAEPSVPTVLMAGPGVPNPSSAPPLTNYGPPVDGPSAARYGGSSESLADSQRSPAASDASHYTSISQRGINPAWRPGGPAGAPPPRNPQNDALLAANPDFALPGAGPGRGRGGVRGRGSPPRGPPPGRYPGGF